MATKICYWWSQSVVYNEGSPVPPYKYSKYEYLHVLLAMTQRSFGGAQTTRMIDSLLRNTLSSCRARQVPPRPISINSRPTTLKNLRTYTERA